MHVIEGMELTGRCTCGEFRKFRVLPKMHCHTERGTSRRIRTPRVTTLESRILRLRSQARSAQDDMHFIEGLELTGRCTCGEFRKFRVLPRMHWHTERGTSRRIRTPRVMTLESRILRLRSQARSAQDDMHFIEGLELTGRCTEVMPRRVLLLGGTTEATELAAELARDRRIELIVSLAGRTA